MQQISLYAQNQLLLSTSLFVVQSLFFVCSQTCVLSKHWSKSYSSDQLPIPILPGSQPSLDRIYALHIVVCKDSMSRIWMGQCSLWSLASRDQRLIYEMQSECGYGVLMLSILTHRDRMSKFRLRTTLFNKCLLCVGIVQVDETLYCLCVLCSRNQVELFRHQAATADVLLTVLGNWVDYLKLQSGIWISP